VRCLPALALLLLAPGWPGLPQTALAQMTVYDPANHAQNVLQAARALQELENQLRQLSHEIEMLENMARNLESLPVNVAHAILRDRIMRIEELMRQIEGIGPAADAIEREYDALYPESYSRAPGQAELVAASRERWRQSRAAWRHALEVTAAVLENNAADGDAIGQLVRESQAAIGQLQAAQAGNQLSALTAQQLIQMEAMLAAQHRADGRKQGRADADDDGEDHQLDAAGDDIAKHPLGEKGGAVPEREGHQHEPGERRQLEFQDGDEQLDGEDEEGDQDKRPGDHHDGDHDEVVEEGDRSEQFTDFCQQRRGRLEPDPGNIAGPQEVCGGQRGRSGPDAELGKAFEEDAGQQRKVAEDQGEEADIEHLLQKRGDDIGLGRQGPEETGERDVDDNQCRDEIGHIPGQQPEAAVDIGDEGFQEPVDDVHLFHASVSAARPAEEGKGPGPAPFGFGKIPCLTHGFTDAFSGSDDLTLAQVMGTVLAATVFLCLGFFGPGIASGLVTGGPQLGAGSAAGTVAVAAAGTALAGAGGIAAVRGAASGVKAGASLAGAAHTAYSAGAAMKTGPGAVAAGLDSVVREAGGAVHARLTRPGDALREAYTAGRHRAYDALRDEAPGAGPDPGGPAGRRPDWARQLSETRAMTAHTLRDGERGMGPASPSLDQDKD